MSAHQDVREGGTWTRSQRWKNDVLYLLARGSLAVLTRLPRRWLLAIGRGTGAAVRALLPRPLAVAEGNVARVFPAYSVEQRRALVRDVYRTLGEVLGETLALLGGAAPLQMTDEARRVFDDARREGRGVVFASAHLGPWESVAAGLVGAGIPLVALARESYDPRFMRLYERLRGARGVGVIYRGSVGAAARIVRTLRGNGVLGVPMDLRSRVPSIEAPFLGLPARTAVGPARIALRTRAAVIVGTAERVDGRLAVTARRLETRDLATGEAGERLLTERINEELSRRILAFPEAWPWMHPRWD